MGESHQIEDFFSKPTPELPKKDPKQGSSFLRKLISSVQAALPSKEQLRFAPHILSAKERYAILGLGIIAIGCILYLPFAIFQQITYPVPTKGSSFREGIIGQPAKINPLLASSNEADKDLVALIYSGLMRRNEKGELIPDLAKSLTISQDGTKYSFELKDGLTWHDGQPVTPEDVIFTVLMTQEAAVGSFQRSSWQNVEAVKTGPNGVALILKNRYAQFNNNLTMGILPKHIWETVGAAGMTNADQNLNPIGSGPYKISAVNRKNGDSKRIESIDLVSFEGFALNQPYISKIQLKFYQNDQEIAAALARGDIDNASYIPAQQAEAIALTSKTVHELKIPRYFSLFLNQDQQPVFKDANVRVALQHATNKKSLVETVLNTRGVTVDSPLLPEILSAPEPIGTYAFNPERARSILESAGFKVNSEGLLSRNTEGKSQELSVEITTSNWPDLITAANAIKAQWKDVGINVSLRILSVPEIQQSIKKRDYQILLFGEVLAIDPDPYGFWHSSQAKESGLNLAGYKNTQVDDILEEARRTINNHLRNTIDFKISSFKMLQQSSSIALIISILKLQKSRTTTLNLSLLHQTALT